MIVETKYGKIQGLEKYGYTIYRGIPYAKPPIGNLRWKLPEKPDKWEGVYQAVDFKSRCAETEAHLEPPYDRDFYDDPIYDRQQSEDCLYLHIWAPKNISKCPVAFWVHGGAYLGGYATEKEFDGEAYCKKGVIFVSVEYRCNIFGFLAHPWLTAESRDHISGNYGLYDILAALTWVYHNIEAFGGDPDNITVFGQSAGAMLVQALLSSELSGKMISKAILQSGGSYGEGILRDISLEEEEQYGERFTEMLGVQTLEELRKLSTEELVEALPKYLVRMLPVCGPFFLAPVIDHKILDGGYYELIDQSKLINVPIMIGTTKNDITVTKEYIESKSFAPLYKGTVAFGEELDKQGRGPVYIYYFSHDLPGDIYGAWHSAELWYMFGTMERCWRPWGEQDWKLSEDMISYWTNFMKKGDPNAEEISEWKPFTIGEGFVKNFS